MHVHVAILLSLLKTSRCFLWLHMEHEHMLPSLGAPVFYSVLRVRTSNFAFVLHFFPPYVEYRWYYFPGRERIRNIRIKVKSSNVGVGQLPFWQFEFGHWSRDMHCLCVTGYFEDIDGKCYQCPAGTECKTTGTKKADIPIKPGYWRTGPNSSTVIKCPVEGVCIGQQGSQSGCKTGHGGHLCMICSAEYAESFSGCTECSSDTAVLVLTTTGIFLGCIFCVGIVMYYTAKQN